VIRRVFGIRGKLWIFRRRYIAAILTNKANISISYYLVPYRLSTDSKIRDLEWPFCVKFCFAPACLDFGALKPGFRSLATLELVVNVVGEL